MNRLLPALLVSCALTAQEAPADRLIREVASRNELMPNLEALCDGIGPRLTGSGRLRRAQAWAQARLRAYGALNVHEEAYDLGRPWRRGVARARLLNANGQRLHLDQMAWTEGTGGPVRGEVRILRLKTLQELEAAAPELKGRIVLLLEHPRATDEERKDLVAFRARLAKAWYKAACGLLLLPSDKSDGLQNMGGGPGFPYTRATAFLSHEDASLLQRLASRGVVPRVEAELGGGFGPKPVRAFNVVGEIPGAERPDEVVIVAVHEDSWDLATGATDNGTGTVVALEVLRAMKASGLRPRRTLRVVLFSGEEEGLLGSRAYLKAHAAELGQVQAVLVDDSGSGRITGFPDMLVDAWYDALTAALQPAAGLGAADVPYGIIGGSDQETFFDAGIPAFAAVQDPLDYETVTHHSQVDTVDHVDPAALVQGAQVMAVAAWGLLNGPKLPHQPRHAAGP
ncbi:MAG TPA: M20/M25/M40 family metallo-hydrolase [Holophagaceae bacterium]|nr:M20/M25/M40 family metallo-hydrolase [Holophagaceae bacterium]